MDELSIISKFDSLVKSGLVLYDDKQEVIEHIDGELKASITNIYTNSCLTTFALVPIRPHLCSR